MSKQKGVTREHLATILPPHFVDICYLYSQARYKQGLSQQQTAKLVGVHYSLISLIERGLHKKYYYRLDLLVKYMHSIGVTLRIEAIPVIQFESNYKPRRMYPTRRVNLI